MEYLEFACDLARAAGEVLKHYASRDKQVELKGRANLVTVADKESEALIIREIQSRFPEHAVLAEESGLIDREADLARGCWIIDPLDGTTNYAHQFPMYSVSVGFEQHGEILCGAVYDPIRDELFSANRGSGAFLNGRPIEVSGTPDLAASLLLTGFPYDFREKVDRAMVLFRAFLMASQAVRRAGSAALDLCYMATGRCDGFWELDLQPWDTAAASVILKEAGGRVTGFRGKAFSIYDREILASNSRIHDEMMGVIVDVES